MRRLLIVALSTALLVAPHGARANEPMNANDMKHSLKFQIAETLAISLYAAEKCPGI